MGLFDKIKTVLSEVTQPEVGKVTEPVKVAKPKRVAKPKTETAEPKPRAKKKVKEIVNPAKEAATKAKEPYVSVLSMELDPNDPGNGAFELDWNDIFVARLMKAGYQGKTDADIVDNWFQTVCRNVVMETWQQEQADPELRRTSNRRDLGNGRTEVS